MKKKGLAMVMGAAFLALTACGGNTAAPAASSQTEASAEASAETAASEEASPAEEASSAEVEASVEQEAAASDQQAGFQEYPIWEDEEIGFLNVSGVYFQPVPMSGGNENYEQFNLHFEADVTTLENDLGYGVGEWVPYMTVGYEIIGSDGNTAVEGTFMPMNADDGPHYGANILLENADTYSVRITFNNPEENGYLIHLDDETGPGGKLEDYEWPLVLELPDVWEYEPVEW